ncbi:hypothetical protein F3157_19755 [Virgibacillus dakarensis]|nr:hypothetical protein [Virgibacillus dakarensis]
MFYHFYQAYRNPDLEEKKPIEHAETPIRRGKKPIEHIETPIEGEKRRSALSTILARF